MKKRTLLIMAFFLGAVIGCSSVYDVQYDYDQGKDFDQLKSYGWLPTPQGAGIDALTVARIQKAVNAELTARGYRLATEAPDFLIAEHVGTEEKVQINDWGYSYGPNHGYWGGTGATAVSRNTVMKKAP